MLFSSLEQFDIIYSFFNLFGVDLALTTILFIIVLLIFIYGFNKNIKFNFFIKILEQIYGFIIEIIMQQLSSKGINKKEVFKASSFFCIFLLFPYQREVFIFFYELQFNLVLDFIKPYLFVLYIFFVLSFYSLILISFLYTNKVFVIYYYYYLKNKFFKVFFNNKNDIIIVIKESTEGSESSNTPEPKDPKRDRIKKILYALLGSVVLVSLITGSLIYYIIQPDNTYQFYLVIISFLGGTLTDTQFQELSKIDKDFVELNKLFGFPKGSAAGSETAVVKAILNAKSSDSLDLVSTQNSNQKTILESTKKVMMENSKSNENISNMILNNNFKLKNFLSAQTDNKQIDLYKQFMKIYKFFFFTYKDLSVKNKDSVFLLNPDHFFSELDAKLHEKLQKMGNLKKEELDFFEFLDLKNFYKDLIIYINHYENKKIPNNLLFLYHYIGSTPKTYSSFHQLLVPDEKNNLHFILQIIQRDFTLNYLEFFLDELLTDYQEFNKDFNDIVMTEQYLDNMLTNLFLKNNLQTKFDLYLKYHKLLREFGMVLSVQDIRILLIIYILFKSCKTSYDDIINVFFLPPQ